MMLPYRNRAALGEALGRSTALIRLNADDCSNMRCAGVASIAAGLQEAAVHMQELRCHSSIN